MGLRRLEVFAKVAELVTHRERTRSPLAQASVEFVESRSADLAS